MPVVASAHSIVTLDPLRQFGEPEIVIVTVHTALATVASITRGAYGTVARSHPQGTVWVNAPLDEDVIEILTSVTRPSDPYRGQSIFETDTNRLIGRSTADVWQQHGLFFDPPACRVYHNAAQPLLNNTDVELAFNSERYDTDSMHNTAVLNNRITINTAGLYVISFSGEAVPSNDYTLGFAYFLVNNLTLITVSDNSATTTQTAGIHYNPSTIWKFAAGDWVTVKAKQINTAAATRDISASTGYQCDFSATWIGRGN